MTQLELPAPAKLNLFLHIVGRRDDGYHNLQTVFQFVDYADTLIFAPRTDDQLTLTDSTSHISAQQNLVLRAAQQLQSAIKRAQLPVRGADIVLHKRLPQGAGLGGGSSDAATTLVGLNKLWGAPLSQQQLLELGLKLGADVPIFIHGHAAFAEGIG
ncbi:MAG TPA: 4-(cytidine 5'-diphospho)-2-C-methyl-D-erythritol kinase, partial [Idiomarina sp.]|nr:4-(cytidine 5'-diphospho)-2-C-methyl-D-erythritol kinase [Idiomarina sp.]